MQVRKSLFLVLAISACFGGSFFVGKARCKAVGELRLAADGGDPMPFPKPIRQKAAVAARAIPDGAPIDGSDPMPRPPHSLA